MIIEDQMPIGITSHTYTVKEWLMIIPFLTKSRITELLNANIPNFNKAAELTMIIDFEKILLNSTFIQGCLDNDDNLIKILIKREEPDVQGLFIYACETECVEVAKMILKHGKHLIPKDVLKIAFDKTENHEIISLIKAHLYEIGPFTWSLIRVGEGHQAQIHIGEISLL